jgi:hypothetical protein
LRRLGRRARGGGSFISSGEDHHIAVMVTCERTGNVRIVISGRIIMGIIFFHGSYFHAYYFVAFNSILAAV